MKKMMIVWFIIAVSLVGILTFIGFQYQKSINKYKTLENDLVESADIYIKNSEINLKSGESIKITSKKLIENKFIDSLNIDDEDCEGYVIVKKSLHNYDFKAYIKCEKYTTPEYDSY